MTAWLLAHTVPILGFAVLIAFAGVAYALIAAGGPGKDSRS
jgi:hypothetical protein